MPRQTFPINTLRSSLVLKIERRTDANSTSTSRHYQTRGYSRARRTRTLAARGGGRLLSSANISCSQVGSWNTGRQLSGTCGRRLLDTHARAARSWLLELCRSRWRSRPGWCRCSRTSGTDYTTTTQAPSADSPSSLCTTKLRTPTREWVSPSLMTRRLARSC